MSLEPLLILFIAPVITILFWQLGRKYADKDTRFVLQVSFLLGIIAFFLSFALISLMEYYGLATTRSLKRTLFYAFVVVGFLEEFSKMVAFMAYAYNRKAFNSPTKGILFSIAIAMGFIFAKNTFFVFSNGGHHFSELTGFLSVPMHILFAIIMGFFLSFSRFRFSKIIFPVLGLGVAAFFHGLFQFSIFSEDDTLLTTSIVITGIMALLLFRQGLKTRKEDFHASDKDYTA
jgi:RsiW-degrading membrane proteinase PrsW (M82 family)